jgi:hypothetical protein
VPLLKADEDGCLQGPTVIEMLSEQQPGRYGPAHMRA